MSSTPASGFCSKTAAHRRMASGGIVSPLTAFLVFTPSRRAGVSPLIDRPHFPNHEQHASPEADDRGNENGGGNPKCSHLPSTFRCRTKWSMTKQANSKADRAMAM